MTDLDIEDLGKEILTLLTGSSMTSKISDINIRKNDGILIEAYRNELYGWALEDPETPAIHVMGLQEELIRDNGEYKIVWCKYAIEIYEQGADSQTLEKQINRYGIVTNELLATNYSDNGIVTKTDYAPTLQYESVLYKVCSVQFQVKAIRKKI